jgi:hypothetical protein
MRKEHKVTTEITINAQSQELYNYLRILKNQDKFNKWAATDTNRQIETTGVDGTVGYIYAWTGNRSAGKGAKEILSLTEGKEIVSEIRFEKPMKTSAQITMNLEDLGNNQTKVRWTNSGELPIPFNIMIPFFEKNFAKDMNESMLKLKTIFENNAFKNFRNDN